MLAVSVFAKATNTEAILYQSSPYQGAAIEPLRIEHKNRVIIMYV